MEENYLEDVEERKENIFLGGLRNTNPIIIISISCMLGIFLWLNGYKHPLIYVGITIILLVLITLGQYKQGTEYLTFQEVQDLVSNEFLTKKRRLGNSYKLALPDGDVKLLNPRTIPDLYDGYSKPNVINVGLRIIDTNNRKWQYVVYVDPKKLECGGRGILGMEELSGGEGYKGDEPEYKPYVIWKKEDLTMMDEIEKRKRFSED